MTYEGYVKKDGTWHNRGTLTYSNGSKYDGYFKNGSFHGDGELTYRSGPHYKGQFRDGEYDGQGEFKYNGGTTFKGLFKKSFPMSGIVKNLKPFFLTPNGKYSGPVRAIKSRYERGYKPEPTNTVVYDNYYLVPHTDKSLSEEYHTGSADYSNGSRTYVGEWHCSQETGFGKSQLYMGRHSFDTYEGYSDGKWPESGQDGQGVYTTHGGNRYEGSFKRIVTSKDDIYEGIVVDGKRETWGMQFVRSKDGTRSWYRGEWKGDVKCGEGRIKFENGDIFEGIFENDQCLDGTVTPNDRFRYYKASYKDGKIKAL